MCPECGCVVEPTRAACYTRLRSDRERVLVGVYCDSDCLLDAYNRGFPRDRLKA